MPKKVDESGPIKGGVKFKAIGNAEELHETLKAGDKAIGIKTPLEFGVGIDGVFKMNREIHAQIKDNFKNLLLTNHGEKPGVYDYGGNLRPLLFEQGEDVTDKILSRIATATSKWMPFIELQTLEVSDEYRLTTPNKNVLNISIKYSIPQLAASEDNLAILLV
jgi:phage baseplate assembly protein W